MSSSDRTGRMARRLIEWVAGLGELIPQVTLARMGIRASTSYARTAVHAMAKLPATATMATAPYSRDR